MVKFNGGSIIFMSISKDDKNHSWNQVQRKIK